MLSFEKNNALHLQDTYGVFYYQRNLNYLYSKGSFLKFISEHKQRQNTKFKETGGNY